MIETEQIALGPSDFAQTRERRIGLIVLETDITTERDFQSVLAGQSDIATYAARVPTSNPFTIESLKRISRSLGRAAASIADGADIDVIAYCCTSGTVAAGFEEIEQCVHEGRPGAPVVTPITGARNALRYLNVGRLSMLTPYVQDVNEPVVEYLTTEGFEVLSCASFNLASDVDIARVSPQAIQEGAQMCMHPEAEAVFISCASLRAVEIVPELEACLGVPVITSVQSLIWDSLRYCDITCDAPALSTLNAGVFTVGELLSGQ